MRHAVALLCLFTALPLAAQKPGIHPEPHTSPTATAKDLPVREVILYKNGIGYFEHAGSVTGNEHVAIDFTSAQLNDVLQSLTILDENGGHIGGVNYNSTTPLAQQLQSLSLAMSDDPSSNELFQALRGQRVEVTGAPGGPITGHLMSIETRTEKPTDSNAGGAVIDRYYLTLVTTTSAVRVIELTPGLSVRPLDANLQGQLDRYLDLLSSTHATGLRHLTLDALGQGQRQLRVSYISEVPVWKSTYRLVFPKDSTDKAILQGWAVVDNTIGSDWNNVHLSLVAGAPQSFIQPLSQPLYLRRPEVPISTTAQTTPQTHETADMSQNEAANSVIVQSQQMDSAQMSRKTIKQSLSSGVAGIQGTGSGAGGGIGSGYAPGSGGNTGGGIYHVGNGVYATTGPVAGVPIDGVYEPTDAIEAGDVATNRFDDFFQYSLAQPVTIHKNESAMVPILQENLPAEQVTLWSASDPTAFRAIWLENTSKLTLDRGSFSIFEGGVFAGQGLLDPIHPGEKQLLSYAADQAVRVRPQPKEGARQLRRVTIKDHGIIEKRYGVQTRTSYQASNSAEDPRVVVIEVPRYLHRTLAPECKAAETTPTLYRFRLPVPAHKSASILVADEGPEYQSWRIDENSDQVLALQRLTEEAPEIADKLKPVIALQQSIAQTKFLLAELDQKSTTLTADEARARDNLTALKGNEGAKRFVDELNRTEDALESTRQQTVTLTDKKKSDTETLRQTLATLEVNWNSPTK